MVRCMRVERLWFERREAHAHLGGNIIRVLGSPITVATRHDNVRHLVVAAA